MADRWMDERDREWRERDWRRSEIYGRGGEERGGAGASWRAGEGRSYDRPPERGYGGADDETSGYGEYFGHETRSCRGRGPKGYQRSDARISEDVNDRLTDDRWLDASDIEVAVKGGEVTLSGHVGSRAAKHRAEWLVEDLSGVRHVQNNLRVDPNAGFTGAGRGFGSSALEAEMRRNELATSPGTSGADPRRS